MNLYEKISAVMQDVKYLNKNGKIDFQKTKYTVITEEKVTSTVRESLIKYGLVILPVKQEHHKEGYLTTVDVTYRIIDAANPDDFVEVVSSGTGADSQDKGVGKAMTYAYKYMLLRTFAIPTGDDPDQISSDELTQELQKNPQYVTDDMVRSFKAMAEKTNMNLDDFMQKYKLDSLYSLSISDYKKFMDKMEERAAK